MQQTHTLPETDAITASLRAILRGILSVLGMWKLDLTLQRPAYHLVTRTFQRIERLLLRYRAGRLWRRSPRVGEPVKRASKAGRGPSLPRKCAWLVEVGKHQAVCYGLQLQHLLSDPEMVALLEAAPQAKRILRPLLRALAVDLPWTVTPPRPPKPRKPRQPRPKPEPFRIPLPRGVLTWARRETRLERAREKLKEFRALA